MTCRTADEAFAAGRDAGRDDPPLSQAQADLAWAVLHPALAAAGADGRPAA